MDCAFFDCFTGKCCKYEEQCPCNGTCDFDCIENQLSVEEMLWEDECADEQEFIDDTDTFNEDHGGLSDDDIFFIQEMFGIG